LFCPINSLFYANNPEIAIMMAGESSRTTHQAPVAIDTCRYLGALIIGLVHERSSSSNIVAHIQQIKQVMDDGATALGYTGLL